MAAEWRCDPAFARTGIGAPRPCAQASQFPCTPWGPWPLEPPRRRSACFWPASGWRGASRRASPCRCSLSVRGVWTRGGGGLENVQRKGLRHVLEREEKEVRGREVRAIAKERVGGDAEGKRGQRQPVCGGGGCRGGQNGSQTSQDGRDPGGELERTGAQRVRGKRETPVGEVAREGENGLKSVRRENWGG